MKRMCGVYMIRSIKKPDKIYIGSSVNLKVRKRAHYGELRRNQHGNIKLQNHFNKYGEGDLLFTILVTCDQADIIAHEQYFIDFYNPSFNICKTAGNCLGVPCSPEKRHKLSIAHKGKKYSEEYKLKMSIALKNRVITEEHRKRISEALKGIKRPYQSKLMSERRKGQDPWNKGLKISEEMKRTFKTPINRNKFKSGEGNCNSKLNPEKVILIWEMSKEGMSACSIAKKMGVAKRTILLVLHRETWCDVIIPDSIENQKIEL